MKKGKSGKGGKSWARDIGPSAFEGMLKRAGKIIPSETDEFELFTWLHQLGKKPRKWKTLGTKFCSPSKIRRWRGL